MIVVSVTRSEGTIKAFCVKGHAGFRPRGEDIVCAAVSMLVQTTLLGLSRYVKERLSYDIDKNDHTSTSIIRCSLPDRLGEVESIQAGAILDTMLIGLKNLQKNYPQYIRVFRRRWTSC